MGRPPRNPREGGEVGPPPERPIGEPVRDLYPVMDARFVLVEIGKLTSKVDRLISDVADLSTAVEGVQRKVAFVRGAFWVISGIVAVVGAGLTLVLTGKIRIIIP